MSHRDFDILWLHLLPRTKMNNWCHLSEPQKIFVISQCAGMPRLLQTRSIDHATAGTEGERVATDVQIVRGVAGIPIEFSGRGGNGRFDQAAIEPNMTRG